MAGRDTSTAAASGLLAAASGLAAGHLTAALLSPAASPVLAVGATVIDLTPTPVKEWAVARFGTADKPILLASVLVVTLVLAALGGVLARRSFALGAAILVALIGAAGAAALARPTAQAVDVVPALVTGVVALGVLHWLVDRHAALRTGAGPSRRQVLLGAGSIAAGATILGATGQWLYSKAREVATIVLPRPTDPAPALPTGLDQKISGISAFRTPNDDFYRVDVNLVVPQIDHSTWSLTIDGDVERTRSFSYADLLAMPLIERDITMTCVSNEVGGSYVGAARWLGVPVRDLLDRTGVGTDADQILSTAVDGFTISTPLSVALDGRDMMVAVAMNGEPLPREHGFPARLITPGLYGYVGGTKWLERLTLTTFAEKQAYWTERGWAEQGPVKVSSRIDTPRGLRSIDAGDTVIAGVAWAQHRGIAKVEVSIDDGAWIEARLGPDAGIDYWRQWYLPWSATKGRHSVAVRATTDDGQVQSSRRVSPFPDGSSGIQQVVVQVD